MKNLLRAVILILLAAFILPSCNSSLSITKRRYTKGYFVHHNPGKHHVKATTQERNATSQVATATPEEIRVLPIARTAEAKRTEASQPAPNVLAQAKAERSADLKKTMTRGEVVNIAVREPVKALKLVKQLSKSADAGDDALSLLWVVIVVILIVYLLGILMDGFGLPSGLIHLLGVIALVLLILWLLRIL